MNYPFILRFSQISNLSDARYAAGMWADFIGFSFDPNNDAFIDPNQAKEIIQWVNGPKVVAEFGHQPIEWIDSICKQLQIDVIEIPHNYTVPEILERGYKIIARVVDSNTSEWIQKADLIAVSSQSFYQKYIEETQVPVLMDIEDFDTDCSKLTGISIKGQKEINPGTSNQSAWTEFLESYEID